MNLVLKECYDSPFSGHLSEDRTREKIKTCIWWPMWQKDVAEYFKTCDRCQKANKSTGKRLEIVHMDWVTCLPSGGDRSFIAFLVIVDSFSKTPIFLPSHKADNAMDTALLIWNRVISWTGIFTNIISEEIQNSPQHYGQIFTNYLEQNCPSLQPTTHKLMAWLKE
ncbi:hypothetical protein O181_003744 [Austropuccinia psidii MF-1]|uniref:Integrase zinc-binding domain-containing protein n=1 Tax=Austropuccinia psidii MF-1 TaxID=1389203 RepID=A0A9Q3BEX6_9BASI|nr:hypothetical protein [Austropuccinia psidii MF-1]